MFVRSKYWPRQQLSAIKASYFAKQVKLWIEWQIYKFENPDGKNPPPRTLKEAKANGSRTHKKSN